MLLAIDTSAGTSVAVVDREGGVLAERSVEDTRRHAEVIGTLIVECLKASGVGASDVAIAALSGVAVGMGPGPFTGLRVGIAAANAFALGAGKPVVRVVSHDALAFAHYAADGTGAAAGALVTPVDPLLVTTDARRHERYWSAYRGADELSLPIRAQGPGLDRPDDLPGAITDYDGYRRLDADWVSAASVGLLAENLYLHGRAFAGVEPLYLRSPDVTLSAGPKRVTV